VVAHRTVFEGRVWDVASDAVELGGRRVVHRDYVRHTGAVAIMAYREPGEVYLVRQYRHPVLHECWEPPAGLLDIEGESLVDAAARELAEEADLTAATWHTLIDYFPSAGGSSEVVRVFLARDLSEVPAPERHERTDEEADMAGRWVALDDVLSAIHAGRTHASSLVAGALAVDAAKRADWSTLRPADAPLPSRD
jgi:ADP-ribose pyrophosphatase